MPPTRALTMAENVLSSWLGPRVSNWRSSTLSDRAVSSIACTIDPLIGLFGLDTSPARDKRDRLLQQLESLCRELGVEEGRSGDVAARLGKALHEPQRENVTGCGDHDGDGRRGLFRRDGSRGPVRHDDVDVQTDGRAPWRARAVDRSAHRPSGTR